MLPLFRYHGQFLHQRLDEIFRPVYTLKTLSADYAMQNRLGFTYSCPHFPTRQENLNRGMAFYPIGGNLDPLDPEKRLSQRRHSFLHPPSSGMTHRYHEQDLQMYFYTNPPCFLAGIKQNLPSARHPWKLTAFLHRRSALCFYGGSMQMVD